MGYLLISIITMALAIVMYKQLKREQKLARESDLNGLSIQSIVGTWSFIIMLVVSSILFILMALFGS